MEKNRIRNAAAGGLIFLIVLVSAIYGQDTPGDTSWAPDLAAEDTLDIPIPAVEDSIDINLDRRKTKHPIGKTGAVKSSDTKADLETAAVETDTVEYKPTPYDLRLYIAKGVGDDLKNRPDIFMESPGTVGSPKIPVEYLNTAGREITLNGLPFIYNGIYRPYIIGSDLEVLPWEIFTGSDSGGMPSATGKLDISLGAPPVVQNRSDVELARGPYRYNGSRWRYYLPLGQTARAYFTVGFKRSDGYFRNSDYDGYHVTGGLSGSVPGGQIDIDLWKHRAKSGLQSFDDLLEQVSRQSRGINRAEIRYKTDFIPSFELRAVGLYQRSAQTITGYSGENKSKNDIGGGEISISDSLLSMGIDLGMTYYNLRLYGTSGSVPSTDLFGFFGRAYGDFLGFQYEMNTRYEGNDIDGSALLPDITLSYDLNSHFAPFAAFQMERRMPDLYLLSFHDSVSDLGYPGVLNSYRFEPDPDLKSPVTSRGTFGFRADIDHLESAVCISLKKIKDQIYLTYSSDTSGNITVSPDNYDDEFLEIASRLQADAGPFTAEISGSYRQWQERYFDDGLEKGPAATGFGRLSFKRQFFIRDLYLGGSLELRASSRRDYRSIRVALTDGFAAFAGRLEFQYKDFIFWLNDENLSNQLYYTLAPYPEAPRTVWWGFRWNFFN